MKPEIFSAELKMQNGILYVALTSDCRLPDGSVPRVGVIFISGSKTRRMPLFCENPDSSDKPRYSNLFVLSEIFYKFKAGDTSLCAVTENGETVEAFESVSVDRAIKDAVKTVNGKVVISRLLMRTAPYRGMSYIFSKEYAVASVFKLFNIYFRILKKRAPVSNRVTFMSGRRTALDGNMLCVYEKLKDCADIDIKTLMFSQTSGKQLIKNAVSFMKLYASSAVIVADDYFRLFNYFDKPEGTKIIQLWHACGAFKTFGYSRIGKPGGPSQTEPNHRMYDYAVVSSKEVARHYAEGFGISDSCVVSLGVPRTDVFFSEEYKTETRCKLIEKYPCLKNKRVVLFAPTFRGNGQQSAYYPLDMLDINAFAEKLGDDTAVIVKLHPFCKERYAINDSLKNRVIDLSDKDELNDILFVTDLLITDYSSAVFEASLLNIPMLFYAFDLEEYIGSRDFYYNYKSFVPGNIIKNRNELAEASVAAGNNAVQTEEFKNKFFDYTDGCSSERVAELIKSLLR